MSGEAQVTQLQQEFAPRTGRLPKPQALPARPGPAAVLYGCPISVARVTSLPPWSVILAPDIIILCDILISSQATDSSRGEQSSRMHASESAGPGLGPPAAPHPPPHTHTALTLACPPRPLGTGTGLRVGQILFQIQALLLSLLNFNFLVCKVGMRVPLSYCTKLWVGLAKGGEGAVSS